MYERLHIYRYYSLDQVQIDTIHQDLNEGLHVYQLFYP